MAENFLLSNSDNSHVVYISIFTAVICLSIVVGHLIGTSKWTNELTVSILMGCIAGILILFVSKGKSSHILRFDEELFFIYLLPPIIFNAGFQVKKKQFFHNFITIMLLGVVGVFISFSIITAGCWFLFPKIGFKALTFRDYLALGVIFSSTDTVCTLQVLHQEETPRLYSLVFGEGVVNDATSVVLFKAIQKIDVSRIGGRTALNILWNFLCLFSTSTILGVAIGLLTAYALKLFYFGRHSTDREVALMMLMAYLSYLLAEALMLSGILTVFFCGIVMSHYAWYNISENSRVTTRHIFSTMSFIAETFIFLYVGMDVFDTQKWKIMKLSVKTTLGINGILIILMLLGRGASVVPLSILSNYISSGTERLTITFKHQFIIWWAGLMRGAVSIALAFNQFTVSGVTWDPVNATMVTSTIIVVLFTTLALGIFTKPLVTKLIHQSRSQNQQSDSGKDDPTTALLDIEESVASTLQKATRSLSVLLESPVHTIQVYWRKFDNAFMRPIFGGPNFSHVEHN